MNRGTARRPRSVFPPCVRTMVYAPRIPPPVWLVTYLSCFFFFFFFQAEDGIRDTSVTGVQTCALPICSRGGGGPGHDDEDPRCRHRRFVLPEANAPPPPRERPGDRGGRCRLERRRGRSEERRVGNERRGRGAADAGKNKEATDSSSDGW